MSEIRTTNVIVTKQSSKNGWRYITVDFLKKSVFVKKSRLKAYDTLAEPFEHLLQKAIPDLIVVDFAAYRISEVAAKYGVSTAFFSVSSAYMLASRAQGFILVRSCEEFEGNYLNIIRELYKKPVLPVGLLPPITEESEHVSTDSSWPETCKWLDGKEPSQYYSLPFLWILRKPQGVDSSDLLPPGFASRTQSQGLVVLDQGLTAKLIVENQAGYEVPRNKDSSFSRDVVAESIRRVLVEDEGEQLRLKAAELQSVFGNHESQDNYINKFIDHLKDNMIKKQVFPSLVENVVNLLSFHTLYIVAMRHPVLLSVVLMDLTMPAADDPPIPDAIVECLDSIIAVINSL
ncbi:hypothetical protein SASPL_119595 [Salvia splendens]|uniref:Uncharacterized protein n=1 Tax=Salvia splendens TaxID=180675 RepID=A0A8X8XTV2_SALSN|nr:hypothetical protein SASPL_119595 [Salvia splendens]